MEAKLDEMFAGGYVSFDLQEPKGCHSLALEVDNEFLGGSEVPPGMAESVGLVEFGLQGASCQVFG